MTDNFPFSESLELSAKSEETIYEAEDISDLKNTLAKNALRRSEESRLVFII